MKDQETCDHKNNIWQAIPIADSGKELFGVRCSSCGLFIACQHVPSDEVEGLVREVTCDIEDRLTDLLTEKFDGIRSELATLTKDAKMLAFEAQMAVLNDKFIALEDWMVEKVNKQPTIEKALEKHFSTFLASMKDVAGKMITTQRPATKPRSPARNKPPKKRIRKRN